MLEKTKTSDSDIFVYDLEDSVAPNTNDKVTARERLKAFLTTDPIANWGRVGVRVNGIGTPFFEDDIKALFTLENVTHLILPKIHSTKDLDYVSRCLYDVYMTTDRENAVNIIPSIESARAMINLRSIAGWGSNLGRQMGGRLGALLFAAEDYCADTGIMRTPSRRELLYTRSEIVITAKAFGLEAIDMVCVQYKDQSVLEDECLEGRQLGFTGKQAIHPAQVPTIQSTYVPSSQEILRAAKILHQLRLAHGAERGAVGLEGEMVDAPMLKQAEKTIAAAKVAGLAIPDVS